MKPLKNELLCGWVALAVPLAACVVSLAACGGGGDSGQEVARTPEEAGRMLYEHHGCVICHGPEGRGDGPIAETLRPPARNFRNEEEFRYGATAGEIATTLERGFEVGVAMPSYDHLSEEERQQIARYIVSLRGGGPEAAATAEGGGR